MWSFLYKRKKALYQGLIHDLRPLVKFGIKSKSKVLAFICLSDEKNYRKP
jgi:hypothetical protein